MIKFLLLCLILLIVAVSGCTEESKTSPNATINQTTAIVTITPAAFPVLKPSTVYVDILGSKFIPPELNVVSGTTVEWKNSDSAVYVLKVDNISSPNLSKRDTWNFTFNRIGTFYYNCTLHPAMPGGKIIVESGMYEK